MVTHYVLKLRYLERACVVTQPYHFVMNELEKLLLLASLRAALDDGRAQRARENAGLSQAEMSRGIEVSASTLNSWESKRRRPRGEAALRYARLLELLGMPSGVH
jgi:DNA-binding transcriptional regulator YiaG